MKSKFQLYLANVFATVVFLAVITGFMAFMGWGIFHEKSPRVLGGALAISAFITLFVILPIVHAEEERVNLRLRDDIAEVRQNRIVALRELEKEQTLNAKFTAIFKVPQSQVDEVLTEAAQAAAQACARARDLYDRGATGFSAYPSRETDPAKLFLEGKAAFDRERAMREEAFRHAVLRFGELWDLAKARGYEVKKCWPEYVGLSSEAPLQS